MLMLQSNQLLLSQVDWSSMVMLMSQSNRHLLLLYVVVPSLDVLLFNIIGSSPTRSFKKELCNSIKDPSRGFYLAIHFELCNKHRH